MSILTTNEVSEILASFSSYLGIKADVKADTCRKVISLISLTADTLDIKNSEDFFDLITKIIICNEDNLQKAFKIRDGGKCIGIGFVDKQRKLSVIGTKDCLNSFSQTDYIQTNTKC